MKHFKSWIFGGSFVAGFLLLLGTAGGFTKDLMGWGECFCYLFISFGVMAGAIKLFKNNEKGE